MTDAFKAVRRNAVNALSELAGFIDGRPEGRAIEAGILSLLEQLDGAPPAGRPTVDTSKLAAIRHGARALLALAADIGPEWGGNIEGIRQHLEGIELAFEDEDAAASAVRGGGRIPRPVHRPYRAR